MKYHNITLGNEKSDEQCLENIPLVETITMIKIQNRIKKT